MLMIAAVESRKLSKGKYYARDFRTNVGRKNEKGQY